ncbi:MAG: glucoamylase family protein [Bacteroidia bacterium]
MHRIYLFATIMFLAFGCKPEPKASEQTQDSPPLSDEQLLDLVQENTFQYFWDGAEPNSGLAAERIHLDGVYPSNDQHIVTSGGTGFGLMAILVGIERGFVTRAEAVIRLRKMVDFLAASDRFHGAWPHWIDGRTGKVKAFSPKDDGGDIVETSFLAQGLLCVRQYFREGDDTEKKLAADIDALWRGIEWDWYQNGQEVMYWHWSPNFGWEMNFALTGYNECLITYVLAASSPAHAIDSTAYHKGWAQSGAIKVDGEKYGIPLRLKHNYSEEYGGPLFWSHYSYLGLDPRELKDRYADYWQHNVNHVLIDRQYCLENPKGYPHYGENCWGLTASYSPKGYNAHQPSNDLGVISPTAALASFPYTPEYSMQALRFFHDSLDGMAWAKYGPIDAFSVTENWFPNHYLAIDQGPIPVMIENHRTGLIWELFMSCPEVQSGLQELGFFGY